jgi:hypothetical protein
VAKKHSKIFLQWYIENSGKWEVCLGPEEYKWQRTVGHAITVAEVWKNLVCEADSTVLMKKRREDGRERRQWMLAYAEKDKTGPIAEVSRVWSCTCLTFSCRFY